MSRREVEAEQRYVDRCYRRLDELRSDATAVQARVLASQSTSYAARTEREGLASASTSRIRQLQIGDEPLVLGRLDEASGERIYVGRVGVTDADHEPLVIDWRAPAAEPFYRATPGEPMGVVRRRHLMCRGREVLGIDDELLDAEAEREPGLVFVGEAALLRAVERSRTGRMRDIVATIQAEQDEIIRAPLEGVLVVQGGPGTGKTAVALHRAAYLLYTHRPRLERSGLLLVGPNPIFLSYVEHVLPSLGEHAVRLATLTDLVEGARVTATDPPQVARLKGDHRMAGLVARAVADLPQPLEERLRLLYDGELFSLTRKASERIIAFVRDEPGTHNERRAAVRRLVLRHLLDLYVHACTRSAEAGDRAPVSEELQHGDRVAFYEAMLRDTGLRRALERMWPEADAAEVVAGMWGDRSRLSRLSDGLFSSEETDTLCASAADGLTEADVPLLDEAVTLIGSPERPADREEGESEIDEEERWGIERMLDELGAVDPIIASERAQLTDRYLAARSSIEMEEPERLARQTFGHVLVDEAQELSPMAWRMLERRCRDRSMTVAGDLAQASGVWGAAGWREALGSDLPQPRVVELTVNYRTPAEIMELAGRVLERVAPGLRPPRSVRRAGEGPVLHRSSGRALLTDAARVARDERAELSEGTVALIAPSSMVGELRHRLGTEHIDEQDMLDAPVAVLAPEEAKGLEFDTVILAEPARVVEEDGGLGALYVSLTRPTRRLVIVHARDLPWREEG